jgi:Holliday junction resolvase RusA-like endonuclease
MRVGEFEIKNIEPMGAVRMTSRGKFVKEDAQRYLDYKKLVYYSVLEQLAGVYDPIDGAVLIHVNFYMPIPASWPKYKKEAAPGEFCTTKPDVDNLVKGLLDALNGLLWVDDNRIVAMAAYKVYADEPGIEFTISRVGGLSHGQAKAKEETKQRGKRKAESRARRDIRARI